MPIPGSKRRRFLEENMAATQITLTQAELDRIDEVAPKDIAAGDRYPDMSSVNRELHKNRVNHGGTLS